LCAAALAFGAANRFDAQALEWRASHGVTVAAGTDSNLYMSALNQKSAQNATVSASAALSGRQPGLAFNFQPAVHAIRYADDAEADRNDIFATVGMALNDSRRSLSLSTGYARESTLTSEFETSGVRADVERVQRDFNVGYSHTLSATRRLSAGVSNVDTNYEDDSFAPYGDYAYRSAQVSTQKVLNERATWTLAVQRGYSDSAFTALDSTNTSLSSSWSVQLSPRLSGSFSIGAYVVDSVGAGRQDPQSSFSVGFARTWQRWTGATSVSRDIRPQAGGLLVAEEKVTLAATRQVAERVSLGVNATGARTSSSIEVLRYTRDYASAGASVSWQIGRRFDLSASVYRRVEQGSFAARATGVAGSLSVSYRGG
jgi:hypothetical protein